MSWRSDWPTRAYEVQIGDLGDRYRVVFRTERGRVVRFTVQLEVLIEGRFRPAIRYDTAHGYPHRDTLDWDGRVIARHWLPVTPAGVAMDGAIDDIKANWAIHREQFLRRKP